MLLAELLVAVEDPVEELVVGPIAQSAYFRNGYAAQSAAENASPRRCSWPSSIASKRSSAAAIALASASTLAKSGVAPAISASIAFGATFQTRSN